MNSGNIQSVIESVKFQVDLVAQNNHLYVQFAQDGGEVPSGIALKIKDLERFEDYQDDIELWRMYEHELYHVERAIAGYNGINLPNELKLDEDTIVFKKYSKIKNLKHFLSSLPDVVFVRMTGTGSAVVAYFKSKKTAKNAAIIFKNKYKSYWHIVSKTI